MFEEPEIIISPNSNDINLNDNPSCSCDNRILLPCFTNKAVEDARRVSSTCKMADVIITSPPYWQKRDYEVSGQIGQEATVEGYIGNLIDCIL